MENSEKTQKFTENTLQLNRFFFFYYISERKSNRVHKDIKFSPNIMLTITRCDIIF